VSIRRNLSEIQNILQSLKESLLKADAKIEEIVQFGSSVYAPQSALDIDILVVTPKKKRDDIYWDAVADCPMNVDIIVVQEDEKIGDRIAWGIGGMGKLIYGDGEILKRMVEEMPVPTYEQAKQTIQNAQYYFQGGIIATEEYQRNGHYRTAFNTLFDAARLAVMTYLNTEETRWGDPSLRSRAGLRRNLPSRFARRFRRIVNTLHVKYFYHSEYPRGNEEAEYRRWKRVVERFINDLETAALSP